MTVDVQMGGKQIHRWIWQDLALPEHHVIPYTVMMKQGFNHYHGVLKQLDQVISGHWMYGRYGIVFSERVDYDLVRLLYG